MVRTVKEQECMDCGNITNYYDICMGRLCPKCVVSRFSVVGAADFDSDIFNQSLIDHNDDIDAFLHLQKEE